MTREEKIRKLLLLKEKKRRSFKNNLFEFIDIAIHIEDKTQSNIVSKFNLWEGQKDVLKDFLKHRLNIILKARQLGISWLTLAYAMWKLVNFMGFTIVALSKTEIDAKELVRRLEFMLRYMPDWIIRAKENKKEGLPYWETTALTVTVYHPNGEKSVFNGMSAGRDSGRSFTADLVILDEWAFQQFAREIWNAAYPTINRKGGGQVIGLSTAKRMTLFEEIWKKSVAKLNTFNNIFLSWRVDPRRDDAWYEQTKKDMGEHDTKVEYPSTPEEAFDVAEGSAFPEFSYNIHVVESHKIPDYWLRWVSVDNGYTDPFAWYWYAVDEQGTVHVYREYTRGVKDPKVTYTDQASQATILSTGETITTTVVGHDAYAQQGARFGDNRSLLDFYKEGGYPDNFTKANTDRRLGKLTINEFLKPYYDENINKYRAKIVIHDCCTKLIETLPQMLVDEKDNEKVAECLIDHWFDSLRYGLNYWHGKTYKNYKKEKSLREAFFGKEEVVSPDYGDWGGDDIWE